MIAGTPRGKEIADELRRMEKALAKATTIKFEAGEIPSELRETYIEATRAISLARDNFNFLEMMLNESNAQVAARDKAKKGV